MRGGIFKRLLAITLALGVFLVDVIRSACRRLIGRRPQAVATVLLYHSIPASQRERFSRQMDILRRIANPVRADVRTSLEPGGHCVAVTFDDGLTSFLETAWPELEQRQIPAAIFVVAGELGTVPRWRNYTPGLMPTEPMLSAEQLRQLPPSIIIGSHSLSHPMLTELGVDDSTLEIAESRCVLEQLLERRISLFSFPYGEWSARLVEQCRSAGYTRVFTSHPSLAFDDPLEFETGRIQVLASDWPIEFALKVVGAYRWLAYASKAKRMVFRSPQRRALDS